jgi:hypothetical protein
MKINPRQRLLAILAIAIVALFAVDRVVVTPLTKSWKDRSDHMAQLRKSIEKGNLLIQRESHTRKRWNEVRKSTLPVSASQAEKELLAAFEKWSSESRVSISSVRPQWKKGASDDYSVLECRVDAAGTLPVLARFLYSIENSPMAVRTESVELTTRDNNGEQIALGLLISAVRLAPVDAK